MDFGEMGNGFEEEAEEEEWQEFAANMINCLLLANKRTQY